MILRVYAFCKLSKKEHYIFGSNLESREGTEKYLSFYFDEKKVEICWFLWFCCLLVLFPVAFVCLFVCLILVGWLVLFCLFMVGFGVVFVQFWV